MLRKFLVTNLQILHFPFLFLLLSFSLSLSHSCTPSNLFVPFFSISSIMSGLVFSFFFSHSPTNVLFFLPLSPFTFPLFAESETRGEVFLDTPIHCRIGMRKTCLYSHAPIGIWSLHSKSHLNGTIFTVHPRVGLNLLKILSEPNLGLFSFDSVV